MKNNKKTLLRSFSMKALQRETNSNLGSSFQYLSSSLLQLLQQLLQLQAAALPRPFFCEYDGEQQQQQQQQLLQQLNPQQLLLLLQLLQQLNLQQLLQLRQLLLLQQLNPQQLQQLLLQQLNPQQLLLLQQLNPQQLLLLLQLLQQLNLQQLLQLRQVEPLQLQLLLQQQLTTYCLNKWCSDNTNGGKICKFGGSGGDKFIGSDKIKKLQLFGGEIVDAISINGTKSGGSGGSPSDEITLDDDEYISEVSVQESFGGYYGQIIVFLEFKTSKGQSIKKGKDESSSLIKFKNIKVTEISGSAGDYLDSITINYINK